MSTSVKHHNKPQTNTRGVPQHGNAQNSPAGYNYSSGRMFKGGARGESKGPDMGRRVMPGDCQPKRGR